jgi:hypothetical protein
MNAPVQGYRPWCPKCGHPTLSVEHGPRIHTAVVSCYMCGWSLYGDDNIRALVEKQSAEFASEVKKKVQKKARPKKATRPVRRVAKVSKPAPNLEPESLPVPGLPTCSWKDCSNPVRLSRGKPTNYCSRKCCVKNAHARDRARRAEKAVENVRSN